MHPIEWLRGTGSRVRPCAAVAAAAAMLGGCAAGVRLGEADVPRLEQAVAQAPADAQVATELGAAYYHAGRYDDARRVLQRVAGTGAESGAAALFLGLSNEQLEDWAAARAAYERYLQGGASGRLGSRIRQRLALVARHELRQQARLALEREQQLSSEPPTPRSVAVFPFEMVGATPELQPLQAALADMVITDLGLTGRVVSIERAQVKSLLDEMVLAQAGYTAPETGARAGRLLRAEHVVQGRLDVSAAERLRLDAAVLNTASRSAGAVVEREGAMAALFDLEKQLVFDILDRLNIQLTPAERERINENRTANLIAFLTHGRGLDALDRGAYDEAAALFRQATQLDPSFGLPQSRLGTAQELAAADAVSLDELAVAGTAELGAGVDAVGDVALLDATVDEVNDSPASGLIGGPARAQDNTIRQAGQRPGPVQEALNQQGIGGAIRATIRLIIPARPVQQ